MVPMDIIVTAMNKMMEAEAPDIKRKIKNKKPMY